MRAERFSLRWIASAQASVQRSGKQECESKVEFGCDVSEPRSECARCLLLQASERAAERSNRMSVVYIQSTMRVVLKLSNTNPI